MRLGFICAVFFAAALFGQQASKPLTLADCVRLANAAPNAVAIARQELRIAALGITASRSTFLPHSGLTGGAIYNSPGAERQSFVAFNGTREYITQAGVAVELDTSGRLRAAYARAKVDRDVAEAQVRVSERDLRRAVTISFYRVLATRKLAESAQALLSEAESFALRVKALFGGGEAAQADVIRALAQAATFEQLKRAADLDARLANQELASYWTADVDATLELEDTLTQQTVAAQPNESPGAFLRRPEFRVFDLQKKGFALDAKRERAALLPQVTLGYQYGIDANRYNWRERGSAVLASVNMPIFDWFRARSLSEQFTARAVQTENARQVSERVYSQQYEAARARLSSMQEQLKTAETQMRLYEQNLKLSRLRYEGGEGPSLDVVVAQTQLQQARTNYFNTLFLFANARADLEVAAGR
jgi:outer membrane protein TolC